MSLKMFFVLLISICLSCKQYNPSSVPLKNVSSEILGNKVDELPTSIWVVFQDMNNNYWFGSNGEGLFKYDGESMVKYTTSEGLAGDQIRAVQEDRLGNIYITTHTGISRFDGVQFETLKPYISEENEWRLNDTDLWFNYFGSDNDIYRYDGDKLYEMTLPRQNLKEAFGEEVSGLGFEGMNTSPYSVFGIDKDKAGNLWIGTIVAGAFRYDGDQFLWIGEKELSTLPDGRVPGVRSMIEDKNGYMWLSNFKSKYKIVQSDTALSYQKIAGMDMTTVLLDDDLPYFVSGLNEENGDNWMAMYSGGAWHYNGEELVNYPLYDGDEEVLIVSIYQDNDNSIWLGTDNAGVYKFDGKQFYKFNPY